MESHKIVSPSEWLAARKALLTKEKELTRLRDQVSAERLKLPWVKVEKDYVFDTTEGRKSLGELFGGRSQLIVYHFMFGPDWKEGCPGCSFLADHIDGANLHLAHHDVTLLAVSRAPLAKFLPFKKRMGWNFEWVSSNGSDFNFDFHVSFTPAQMAKGKAEYNFEEEKIDSDELPGLSMFYKDEKGGVFHTYSTYARGGDILIGAYNYLDMAPLGRNESGTMDWMRHHDRYEDSGASCCHGKRS
jgi:predicted dithiol-disulfide oxidoreductase (DUF899 family)